MPVGHEKGDGGPYRRDCRTPGDRALQNGVFPQNPDQDRPIELPASDHPAGQPRQGNE